MGRVIDFEEALARRMGELPPKLFFGEVADDRVRIHVRGIDHTIDLSPEWAEAWATALTTLAATARANRERGLTEE